jgi:hypothetical protein
MLMLFPYIATNITGTGHRAPMYNIALSNLPGSKGPRYLHGAEAEAMHPTTIIYNGAAVIVVLTSWNGKLCFTCTACPTVVPRADEFAEYLVTATDTVEKFLANG